MLPAWRRRFRRGGLVAGGVLVAVSVIGGLANWAANRAGFARVRPPGLMVRVRDHRLHLDCQGHGGPTVVFESALGGWSIDWALVQPGVAAMTRACSYDRAGYGWSDPAHRRYSPDQTAEELHALLHAAGVPGPYVVVGHSLGGLYARRFAARYPTEVAGMVLIDASHENMLRRLPSSSDAVRQTRLVKYLRFLRYATITGVTRLMRAPVANSPDLRGPQRAIASAIGYRYDDYEAFYNEAAAFVAASRDATFQPEAQPPVPLAVLTSSLNADDPKTGNIWRDLQDDLAAASPTSTHTIVNSGHFIQVQKPHAVVDAVAQVLRQSRQATPGPSS